jgi:hypothetical protein
MGGGLRGGGIAAERVGGFGGGVSRVPGFVGRFGQNTARRDMTLIPPFASRPQYLIAREEFGSN